MAWVWIILALVYILSPYDLIPDFIPLRGWIDDFIVLLLLIRYVMRLRTSGSRTGRQWSNDSQNTDNRQQGQESVGRGDANAKKNPYEILGVSAKADLETIRSAYRRLAGQYHPDKVAHLGPEFQEMAEKRFKEIQEAYEKLTRSDH